MIDGYAVAIPVFKGAIVANYLRYEMRILTMILIMMMMMMMLIKRRGRRRRGGEGGRERTRRRSTIGRGRLGGRKDMTLR